VSRVSPEGDCDELVSVIGVWFFQRLALLDYEHARSGLRGSCIAQDEREEEKRVSGYNNNQSAGRRGWVAAHWKE